MQIKCNITVCRECGKEYKRKDEQNNGFCSAKCSKKYRKKHPDEKDYQKICRFCGQTFGTNSQAEIYCSLSCRKKAEPWKYPYECVCQYCGELFMAKTEDSRFCSSKCAACFLADETRKPPEERRRKKDSESIKICRQCGKEYRSKKRGREDHGFCCKYCADTYRIKNKPPKYTKVCEYCGIEFGTNAKKQRFCGVECRGMAYRGRTVYVKNCLYCGKEFETINPKQQYCCSTCGSRHHGEQIRGEYFCEYCGKPRHSEHPNRNRFCSRACAIKARIAKTQQIREERAKEIEKSRWKICAACGGVFYTKHLWRLYCSDECAYKENLRQGREQYAADYEPRNFVCAECGKEVTTTCGDKHSAYCSTECAHRAENRKGKQRRKQQMEEAFVEDVSQEEVYRKASGYCSICGLPVPHTWECSNAWAATVDHVAPLSQGGLHMKSNCQLAHRMCNSLKGTAGDDFRIDWPQKLKEEPGRWNERLDDLWVQLGLDVDELVG